MEVTESFVEYIKTKPIVFEVFGHYQQHPLHLQGQDLNRYCSLSWHKGFVIMLGLALQFRQYFVILLKLRSHILPSRFPIYLLRAYLPGAVCFVTE